MLTRNWYLTMSTLPNNYLLHIPLEQKSVLSVTRPFLSEKGWQCQTTVVLGEKVQRCKYEATLFTRKVVTLIDPECTNN